MGAQMYVDLITKEILKAAANSAEPTTFSLPIIGTLSGSSVMIDAISEPVPYSEFQFAVDDKTETKPNYKNGDRLFIVPANDGKQLVITGRLI